ncbi:hypothetical protein [Maribacter sp. MAR_2009_72]|uniref:hypothetical protein n=1 Tax=Maribacter sp. MAR_2009_72 TaxID=1250050 RepID=UPI0011990853|nr:hypothetical protein [Maribacter sp. MAR_2009_72]TVZ15295.1 hypothetical protein JM81_1521 [Maribacter sp. MAR_2009_72]
METDKFEQHIKNKLREREISPSDKAWASISSELKTDTQSKSPLYTWLGIAASVVIILGVALFVMRGEKNVDQLPVKVVDTENEQVLKPKTILKEERILDEPEEGIVVKSNNSNPKVKDREVPAYVAVERQRPKEVNELDVATVLQKSTNEVNPKIEIPEEIINTQVALVVAQVNDLEQYNTVTDAEVDSLLQRAQDEILRNKIFNTDKSVNAMALLTKVEEELDQSFRDQIFNSLKASFIKVRTAVADRNN